MRRLIFLLAILPSPSNADDFRPLYIELNELQTDTYSVRIKLPPNIPTSNYPSIHFPTFCHQKPNSPSLWACDQDIGGSTVSLKFPGYPIPSSSVVKLSFVDGVTHTITLSSGVLHWRVPLKEEVGTIAVQYTWLGMEHIWVGFDHLLFVLCLIWIAGSWRRILVTISGFTVAHSITLALAAIDVVRLPVPPIEAAIALSVVFLAAELLRPERDTLTWRYPVAVSSVFGLLHGLGFAAVLGEIGLPQKELLAGLVFFNVGVEIGQVLFAAVVVACLYGLRRVAWFEAHGHAVLAYPVGAIAAYWFVERTASFL